ncbi:family 20 glycosylhydrolase [Kribbella sp. NPDC059898]|uniref:family 20 glycosylhydrolase n=1 Tax=Kribbella sp. NPDC059898 TaxID=3346995 RepID=UPI0036675CD7
MSALSTSPRRRLLALAGLVIAATLTAATPTAGATTQPVNLALNGTATASSVELNDSSRFGTAFAKDGRTDTRWSSGYQDDNWVQVKLASPAHVDHVVLRWPNACARDYVLQTSTDGTAWHDVTRVQRDACPRTDVVDVQSETPISFVRMQGKQRFSQYGYSLSEFEIYDQPEPAVAPGLGLVPKPVSVTEPGGAPFGLGAGTRILAAGPAAVAPARYLASALRPATGFDLPVTPVSDAAIPDGPRGNSPAPIIVRVRPGGGPAGHEAEGYHLTVSDQRVDLVASTTNGALNGVQTLRQLLPQWIESRTPVSYSWTVPAVSITDYPRFAHRGVMLDVARSFYPVPEVKRYIDDAARFKINRLHLHLTDDQGWRIAVGNPAVNPSGIDYGLLTKVSGATAMTYNSSGQLMGTELGVTGYYTKADYAEIVRYAGVNGMTVIPEIDVPSHINAALHAIPQLNTAGSQPRPAAGQETVPSNGTPNVGYSSLDANSEVTYEFVQHVLTEIARLTPGPYLHIGGDEAHVTSHADYVTMVDRFAAQAAALGKTVVGWNEYAGTALPRDNAVIQYWNGDRTAVANAVRDRGAKVVLSPASNTYVPQKQDARQPVGGTWACGGPCGLDRHYNWDPGTYIPGIGQSDVLGVESALWGEFIRHIDQAEYYAYPRIAATAEVGWTPQNLRNYGDFTTRLAKLGGRLTLSGTNFFPTADVPWTIAAHGNDLTTPAGTPATVEWIVTAPGETTAGLTATVTWNDGTTEPITLTQPKEGSISLMRLNGPLQASATRTFNTPATYVATLSIKRPGQTPTESSVTVTTN